MPQSYLVFDFGANEQAAQQARHRLEGWRQAFRLDRKLQLKFERTEPEGAAAQKSKNAPAEEEAGAKAEKPKAEKGKGERAKASKAKGAEAPGEKGKSEKAKAATTVTEESASEEPANQLIRLIVRLDFSDHERLSHHRWLERIPIEEPFKDASPKIIRHGEADFDRMADTFDSLSAAAKRGGQLPRIERW